MFKALIAATAMTVCCLGNDYPAKSHHEHFRGDVFSRTTALDVAATNFVRMGEAAGQRQQLRELIREEIND